ncbi:hypothetical protein BGZ65_006956 [Modicella reniformis]|uniref:Uncharacterized protein n=1 Tax=Modicella reniformis TaxID=1440133 RepID=A0A9P6MAX5_9FUNG|nr:hypothetical protein BGZ65_006956 [Modicella reniformis]
MKRHLRQDSSHEATQQCMPIKSLVVVHRQKCFSTHLPFPKEHDRWNNTSLPTRTSTLQGEVAADEEIAFEGEIPAVLIGAKEFHTGDNTRELIADEDLIAADTEEVIEEVVR